MDNPIFSIVMPAYNAEKTIEESIKSIIKQSFQNFELIIIEDCSKDNTFEIINKFKSDPRLKIIKNEVNLGFNGGGNYSKALTIGSGKYHAIFHADDVYNEYFLEEALEVLEKNINCAGIFTAGIWIDENGFVLKDAPIPKNLKTSNTTILNLQSTLKLLMKNFNFMIAPSFIIKNNLVKNKIKIFDYEKYEASGDLDMWLRILEDEELIFLNKKLIKVRQSKSQWSNKVKEKMTRYGDFFTVMDDYTFKYKDILNSKDFTNYNTLKRIEEIRIIIAKIKLEQITFKDFKLLIKIAFSINFINIKNFRFLKWYLYSYYLQFKVIIKLLK